MGPLRKTRFFILNVVMLLELCNKTHKCEWKQGPNVSDSLAYSSWKRTEQDDSAAPAVKKEEQICHSTTGSTRADRITR